jgi:hypothetical protein
MKGDYNEILNYIFKNNRSKIRSIIFINKLFTDAECQGNGWPEALYGQYLQW